MANKVRIGLLVDSHEIPHWAYAMVERLKADGYADIALVVTNQAPPAPTRGFLGKLRENYGRLLYLTLLKLEGARYAPARDPFASRDLRQLLPDVRELPVAPRQTKFSDYISAEDAATIRSCQLDVLIRLGFRILRGEILACARLGVWSYHHGDNERNRGGPAGFWEVMEGWPETGSVLQVLTEDLDGGEVLYRSWSQTDLWSLSRNRANFYWKSLSFIPRKIAELHRLGAEEFSRSLRGANQHPAFYSSRLYKVPRERELARLAAAHFWRYARAKARSLFFFEQWILLYALKKKPGISTSFWRFNKIIPPKDRIWADPFAVRRDGLYHVFIEEMPLASNRGHISRLTIDDSGRWTEPVPIIREDYHLSYPFVFSHDGTYYLVPESAENRTVDLYECVEFPGHWRRVRTLLEGVNAVDATLHYRDGRWWLFANIREQEGASTLDELFLFYADDLLDGPWHPHPQNPVVSDVKSARPAGRLFEYNGNLYRPSQDNAGSYGAGMRVNHVVALDEDRYREECVAEIRPDWERDLIGVHTLNHCHRLTVSDGLLRRRKYG